MNSIKFNTKMETICMNSENIKTSGFNRILLNISDKINLEKSDKYVALLNLTIYYTWKNIKRSHSNITFEISVPTWNELLDKSFSISYIQDYFKYIIEKHETVTDNPPIRIYMNQIESRITFKI